MVEVLKVGNIAEEKDWSATVTCHECKAVIKGKAEDLKLELWYGSHFEHKSPAFECPCCGYWQYVETPDPIFKKYLGKKKAVFRGHDHSIY